MIKHISEKLNWYEKTPFYYTSMFGYRCFRWNRSRLGMYKFRLKEFNRKINWKIYNIIYHYPICSNCNHSLKHHISYDKAPDKEGVCVSFDTPTYDSCGCENWS